MQVLRIIFTEYQVLIDSSGLFSGRIKKILDSLTNRQGVFIKDYYEFIQVLNTEGWGRGDTRDTKEFFTFIIEKLKSEGNRQLEGLFSTKIEKQHKIDCKFCASNAFYWRNDNIEKFADSVTIINVTSSSLAESIRNRIERESSLISDYPCKKCNRPAYCSEKIQPTLVAKVFVLYQDPNKARTFNQKYQNSAGFICSIAIRPGHINHFVVYTKNKIIDDNEELPLNGYYGRADIDYLIFLAPSR